MLLKVEVGGCALNDHGNYIVDHGKIMELCFLNFCGNPALCMSYFFSKSEKLDNFFYHFAHVLIMTHK